MDGKDFGEIWKFVVKLIIILAIFLSILFATMQFGNKSKAGMTNVSSQTQTVEGKSNGNPTINETGPNNDLGK